ncbi:hypothetical protein GCM10008905_23310 [Clostridium malenominatum]|uniref:DUF951 domain-containing protein n=1 Tax=Clostridium malenominatum TaxID=1539 RepID=A0ABP3UCE4_9CLOT
MDKIFELGDIVEMKKTHPCGSKEWKIIRMGADIKIKCCICSRIVMIERNKFEKDMKKIIKKEETIENE